MARGSLYANFFKLIFHYREHIVLFLSTIAIYLEPYLTIRFTLLMLRQTKRTSDYLSVFVFRHLTTGILHDTVHRAACGVNPGSLIYPQTKKRKRRTVFVLTKNGAQQGARRLDKKNYL